MTITALTEPPNRIRDLIRFQQLEYELDLDIDFEIIPVNFAQTDVSYQAYIFICRFEGTMDNKPFGFRKCYAKGCPHNLCPHVAQAVMVANRYLARDYKKLSEAGICPTEKYFSLEKMVTDFEEAHRQSVNEVTGGILTIHDYIRMAREGHEIKVETRMDIVPGGAHFSGHKIRQNFLMADFEIMAFGNKRLFQRCVACFSSPNEHDEKSIAVTTANDRLKQLYIEFEEVRIDYTPCFFN